MSFAKTTCPVSRSTFKSHATPLAVNVGGNHLSAAPKDFSTGSMGYYANGKVTIPIDGVPVVFQCGITLTAVGSKELD